MNKGQIFAAVTGLSALTTGAAMAECGVESLIEESKTWKEPMIAISKIESPLDKMEIEAILDNMVCQAWGAEQGSETSLREITSNDLETVANLKRLADVSLISASFQEMGRTGPVEMESSSSHLSLSFNPLMSEKSNATAGLAMLNHLIERGISGEGTNVECVYRAEQVQCTDKIAIEFTP